MVSNLLFISVFSSRLFVLALASSFLWIWLGIELISLSVAIYILVNSSVSDIRGKKGTLVLKYLIVQFVARRITLRSSLLSDSWWELTLVVALSLKLGLVPLHSWVVDLFGGVSLIDCIVLRVVSKIRPLLILAYWLPRDWAFILGALSIVRRSFMGIIYGDLRHIMRCSSIIGTRWLSISAGLRPTSLLLCFFFYRISNVVIFWLLEDLRVYSLSDSATELVSGSKIKIVVSLVLITNLRLPIFLFFIVKLVVILETKWYFVILATLILSRVSIIWYSRVINSVWSYEGSSSLGWTSHSLSPMLFAGYLARRISRLLIVIYLICWFSMKIMQLNC